MSKISIVIPVYNVEKYLDRCLESVVSQSLRDIEIIIVNDGSTDNSHDIILKYATSDARIIVIHQENQGLAIARNNGTKMVTGEYILYVDSDDYIEVETCEKLYATAKKQDAQVVIFDYVQIKDKEKLLIKGYDISSATDMVSLSFPTSAWNKLFKTDYLNTFDSLFMEGVYYEDFSVVPFLVASSKKVAYLQEALYNYDITRNDNIMKQINEKIRDMLIVCERLVSLFKTANMFEQYKNSLLIVILPRIFDVVIKNRLISNTKESILFYSECINFLNSNFKGWRKVAEAYTYSSQGKILVMARRIMSYRMFYVAYCVINPSWVVKKNIK